MHEATKGPVTLPNFLSLALPSVARQVPGKLHSVTGTWLYFSQRIAATGNTPPASFCNFMTVFFKTARVNTSRFSIRGALGTRTKKILQVAEIVL